MEQCPKLHTQTDQCRAAVKTWARKEGMVARKEGAATGKMAGTRRIPTHGLSRHLSSILPTMTTVAQTCAR